jgi:spore maturation protein CgeB
VDLVWVDKGRHIYPETLAHAREKTGARLVHYTPDAQLLLHKSRHFRACIPLYDLVVTTKPFELDLYRAIGARQVMLVLQGFDGRFVPRVPTVRDCGEFGSDVAFIGHCERHYAERLEAVCRVATRLRIWGDEWPRYAQFHGWARAHVAGGGIWGQNYPRALACTKIALGLLSKRIPETTTTRTFEIPAIGVFLLAERTDDHLALFREGIEAEFFGSDDELQEKIVFYLNHDNARLKIAAAGRKRCVQSGYRAESQIEKVLTRLTKLGN